MPIPTLDGDQKIEVNNLINKKIAGFWLFAQFLALCVNTSLDSSNAVMVDTFLGITLGCTLLNFRIFIREHPYISTLLIAEIVAFYANIVRFNSSELVTLGTATAILSIYVFALIRNASSNPNSDE